LNAGKPGKESGSVIIQKFSGLPNLASSTNTGNEFALLQEVVALAGAPTPNAAHVNY
jgi:hypothetical protein